ncbi:thioredoxin family protein [Enterococcus saccharolyticus]|uniref:thioredoxin family protein n=1 Tax=Enterococcus saccharolyticus TaxID=41997 RepID=UPI001E3C4F99|nr:thioredoxin family protein [Enterococcus saccharolyticus]MCD5002556.1 thioredoxin family protein [Enterococcus saccharolyticus]
MQSTTFTQFQNELTMHPIVLLYISTPTCSVCHAIKPKIEHALTDLPMFVLDAHVYPEVASAYQALTAPVVLLFFEGKEVHRQARFIDIPKLVKFVQSYQSMNLSVTYQDLFN